MNGRARREIRRAVCILLAGAASACGDGAVEPPPPPTPVDFGRSIATVSGNDQKGLKGVALDAFVARVTAGDGTALSGVEVEWSLLRGEGAFLADGSESTSLLALTDGEGRTAVTFTPTRVGGVEVAARLTDRPGTPASFQAEVLGVAEITFWGSWSVFTGSGGETHVTVPVGFPVEWVNHPAWEAEAWTVTSTAVPAGGASFDSGVLGPDGRFEFVPRSPGTWEYVDRISGATATVTARGETESG